LWKRILKSVKTIRKIAFLKKISFCW